MSADCQLPPSVPGGVFCGVKHEEVPEYIEMSMYASFIELMDPFLAISLPIMEQALAAENNYEGMAPNSAVPPEPPGP